MCIKGYYSPIVKIIYFLPFDVSDIDKAYNKYKQLLDSLPKHAEYAEHTPEYYKGYDYVRMRSKMHEITKQIAIVIY